MRRYTVWWMSIPACLMIVLDQWSKHIVITTLWQESFHRVFAWLNVTLAFNNGAAFSLLAQGGAWSRYGLSVFALLVILGVLLWWWQEGSTDRCFSAAVGLLIGGALGNVIDRIRYGTVIDFIDVHWRSAHFATFNVADSAVTVGVLLLLWRSYQLRGKDCSK